MRRDEVALEELCVDVLRGFVFAIQMQLLWSGEPPTQTNQRKPTKREPINICHSFIYDNCAYANVDWSVGCDYVGIIVSRVLQISFSAQRMASKQ